MSCSWGHVIECCCCERSRVEWFLEQRKWNTGKNKCYSQNNDFLGGPSSRGGCNCHFRGSPSSMLFWYECSFTWITCVALQIIRHYASYSNSLQSHASNYSLLQWKAIRCSGWTKRTSYELWMHFSYVEYDSWRVCSQEFSTNDTHAYRWQLADGSQDSQAAVYAYGWNTHVLYLANRCAYGTKQYLVYRHVAHIFINRATVSFFLVV